MRSWLIGFVLVGTLVGAACSDGPSPFQDVLSSCDLFSDKIFDGGPGRDGIPALTNPAFTTAGAATHLTESDRVLGVVIDGAARAYPFIVMWWHEMVNDTLGGTPVLVSYCPLTGSGLAFDRRVSGQVLDFGVSGIIFENNLVMFDRQSESLWPQMMTSARCGSMLGTTLAEIAIVEATWGRWKELYPNTTVLTNPTEFDRPYGQYPYGDYDLISNDDLLFPSSSWSTTRQPKEVTLGIVDGDAKLGFPYVALYERGSGDQELVAVNEDFAGRPIVVTFHRQSSTAIAYERTVEGQALDFRVHDTDTDLLIDEQTGSVWRQTGVAVDGPLAGAQLAPVPQAYPVFWFAWTIFHRFARNVE